MSCRGRLDTPRALFEAQVLVVAAAGNALPFGRAVSCTADYDPMTTPDKLIVGATNDLEEASYFSNYGACVHVHVRSPAAAHLPARPLPHGAPRPAARVRRPLALESWVLG